jgi:hypothetical protein
VDDGHAVVFLLIILALCDVVQPIDFFLEFMYALLKLFILSGKIIYSFVLFDEDLLVSLATLPQLRVLDLKLVIYLLTL